MRIPFLKMFFKTKAQKIADTISQKNLAQRAEQRLQSRITDWHTLMRDVRSGDILEISTGKKFTGKFVIDTDELEHLQHVKDGKTTFIFVRDKNGKKLFATTPTREKDFSGEKNDCFNWGKLAENIDLACEQMRHKFVIKELMKSGKDSIFIQGSF